MEFQDEVSVGLNMDDAFFVAGDIDVKELLSGEGAAGEGGSLAQVNDLVKDYGRAGISIGQTIGVYVFTIVLVVSGILMMVHSHNVNKRSDDKGGFGWAIAGGIIVFAAFSIVLVVQGIGTGLFG